MLGPVQKLAAAGSVRVVRCQSMLEYAERIGK